MKKIIIAGMALLAATSMSFAQGQVFCANTPDNLVVNCDSGIPYPIGSAIKIQLFYSANTSASMDDLVALGTPFGISSSEGRFKSPLYTLPDVGYDTPALFQIRIWDGPYTTWEEALHGFAYSYSALFTGKPTPLPFPPSSLDLPVGNIVFPFLIPEPSTIALGVMGLSTLLFRRRK